MVKSPLRGFKLWGARAADPARNVPAPPSARGAERTPLRATVHERRLSCNYRNRRTAYPAPLHFPLPQIRLPALARLLLNYRCPRKAASTQPKEHDHEHDESNRRPRGPLPCRYGIAGLRRRCRNPAEGGTGKPGGEGRLPPLRRGVAGRPERLRVARHDLQREPRLAAVRDARLRPGRPMSAPQR